MCLYFDRRGYSAGLVRLSGVLITRGRPVFIRPSLFFSVAEHAMCIRMYIHIYIYIYLRIYLLVIHTQVHILILLHQQDWTCLMFFLTGLELSYRLALGSASNASPGGDLKVVKLGSLSRSSSTLQPSFPDKLERSHKGLRPHRSLQPHQ